MKNDHKCVDVNASASLDHCENTAETPITTPANPGLITRLPVTLAEVTVNTSLSANIQFPDPVLEIKDIKKRVKIVQCRLLLPGTSDEDDSFVSGNYQLFLRGFVRKNIQYATPDAHGSGQCVSSKLRSLTVDVPFECVTTVLAGSFLSPPQLPVFNSRNEFDFFRAQDLGTGHPEKEQLLSSDLSQFHQNSSQYYNQFPYCELLSSDITEYDEAVDRVPLPGDHPFEEGYFHTIVEKMFLQFTIKILQNQQVIIEALAPAAGSQSKKK